MRYYGANATGGRVSTGGELPARAVVYGLIVAG